jgi:hypothetical protein
MVIIGWGGAHPDNLRKPCCLPTKTFTHGLGVSAGADGLCCGLITFFATLGVRVQEWCAAVGRKFVKIYKLKM